MATPHLSALKMAFRREIADVRNVTSGMPITASTEDGKLFTSAALDLLIVDAIRSVFTQIWNGMQGVEAWTKTRVMADNFPEYVERDHECAGNAGDALHFSADLPTDFWRIISARYRNDVGSNEKMNQVPFSYADAVLEGLNTEIGMEPVFCLALTKIHVFRRTPPMVPANDKIVINYLATQPNITDGGATDIKINTSMDAVVLLTAKQLAFSYQQ